MPKPFFEMWWYQAGKALGRGEYWQRMSIDALLSNQKLTTV
ncbi:hypothetical protein [Bartonella sp. AA74HLJMH]